MLQTWAEDGTQMLALDDRIFKFFNIASVGWSYTGSTQQGSIYDTRFTQYPGCEPQAFLIDGSIDTRGGAVSLRFDGNYLIWEYPRNSPTQINRLNATFVYGIF